MDGCGIWFHQKKGKLLVESLVNRLTFSNTMEEIRIFCKKNEVRLPMLTRSCRMWSTHRMDPTAEAQLATSWQSEKTMVFIHVCGAINNLRSRLGSRQVWYLIVLSNYAIMCYHVLSNCDVIPHVFCVDAVRARTHTHTSVSPMLRPWLFQRHIPSRAWWVVEVQWVT